MNAFKRRILDVALSCRETAHPDSFYMGTFGWPCGTPGCALGNYAVRRDLQDEFALKRRAYDRLGKMSLGLFCNGGRDGMLCCDAPEIQHYFGITEGEAGELFSGGGCGGAKDAVAAAEYLERFAERKWPEPKVELPAEVRAIFDREFGVAAEV